MRAKIIKSTGSWYQAVNEEGLNIACRIKGKLKMDANKNTNPIAVGDWVHLEQSENDFVIENWEERKNMISRASPKHQHARHIIAANIDLALVLATISQPRTSTGFIDRFLLTAQAYHIPAVIVFNKTDCYGEKEILKLKEYRKIYEMCHYDTFEISVLQQHNIAPINELLQNKTTLIAGHSGVGKSSLINCLSQKMNLRTNSISIKYEKGKHTTTHAEMFALDQNTFIIDTPGIKEFGITDLMPEEIGGYFKEFLAFLPACKFHNCLHEEEPNCGIINAVMAGKIHVERYKNYLNILDDARKKPRYLIRKM